MVLQVPQGIGYILGGIQRQQYLESGFLGGLGIAGEDDLLGGCPLSLTIDLDLSTSVETTKG